MATIRGTDGNDILNGTANNPANGTGTYGDDTIIGLGGNDRIDGRGGIDTIDAGSGNDIVFVNTFGPVVRDESSVYDGGADDDTLDMSGQSLSLSVAIRNVVDISGGAGASLTASNFETLFLGSGADVVRGNGFFGQPSLRQIFLGAGDDSYDGGGGSGSMVDRDVAVEVHGGAGSDRIAAFRGSLYGDEGDDILDATTTLTRPATTSNPAAVVAKYAAAERTTAPIYFSADIRTIDGGAGIDTFLVGAGYMLDLSAGLLKGSNGAPLANIVNIEKVVAAYGDARLIGSDANDVFALDTSVRQAPRVTVSFFGGGGNDTLDVGAARGLVSGGAGDDSIYVSRMTDLTTIRGLATNLSLNVDGGAGRDVLNFAYSFREVKVSMPADVGYSEFTYQPSDTDIGYYRVFGVERYVFSDLTIALDDGKPLVDDLYYLGRYRDVVAAKLDADDHYAQYGWREARDPNAVFSTSGYLGLNADVKAGGLNPLDHYAQYGWREGRDASAAFDTTLYLLHNPDVKAASLNPLEHYLQYGRAEGRAAYAAVGTRIDADGFDAQTYLLANPDVAAAARGASDPAAFAALHYATYGWREGRDPNSWFDSDGYLAAYSDVAAAGLNPLDHYARYGWKEGRDPSAGFDTTDYLAANPDVARSGINPLVHFLTAGVYELRSAFGDGSFDPI